MGKPCARCGKNTGLLRGTNEFRGNVYCGTCIGVTKAEFKEKFLEACKEKYNIPKGCYTVKYKSGYAKMPYCSHYVWLDNGNLNFSPTDYFENEERYVPYKVTLDNIEYFTTRGEVHRELKISGGGGTTGGSSLGGAIVGGLIAGGAGAVIGSRKEGKIQEIKSETITIDKRETFLNFFVDNIKHSLFFEYRDYNTFLKLIPDKDFSNFQRRFLTSNVNQNIKKDNTSEILKQIEQLSGLKNNGILTEDEFNEKKKLLLEKIK